jgi:hypothetical protein
MLQPAASDENKREKLVRFLPRRLVGASRQVGPPIRRCEPVAVQPQRTRVVWCFDGL